jgi:glycosyl transferase family 9 (putative heptosyltransferase)
MRILIIRPGAIGDTLLTFPIIQALRERHVDRQITLVGNAAVLPLALEAGLAEEAFDYGQLRWSQLFVAAGCQQAALRALLCDSELAVCWLHDGEGVLEQNLRSGGARRVIVAPGRPPAGERRHVVDYLAETVGLPAAAGLHTFTLEGAGRRLPVSGAPRVAVHPGSGGAPKCWPVASFADLIKRLWQNGSEVLLLLGQAERERWNELQRLLPPPPEPEKFKLLAGAPLLVVAEQVRRCRCYLGNDAGITHLAAMLGVPTIVLFGPSDPAVWRPVGQAVEVMQARPLEELPVSLVLESILKHL